MSSGENRAFCGHDGSHLIRAKPHDLFRWRVQQPLAGIAQIQRQHGFHGRARVEIADGARNRLIGAHVEVPDDFAIRGVEERDVIAIPVAGTIQRAFGIALGLLQHILRINRDLFGFEDAEKYPVYKQRIIRRAIIGGKFSDRVAGKLGGVEPFAPRDDLPGR
jgi:hypothetical protein